MHQINWKGLHITGMIDEKIEEVEPYRKFEMRRWAGYEKVRRARHGVPVTFAR
jgi:hypothetical protein